MEQRHERAAARRRHERFEQRRVEQAASARSRLRVLGAVLAALLVVGAVVALSLRGGEETMTTAGSPSDTPSGPPAPASGCAEASSDGQGEPGSYEEPALSVEEGASYTATLATNCGDVVIELDPAGAPSTVSSFRFLADEGYFDGTRCHRLVSGGIFVLQCGDPTATGTGGPGYTFDTEAVPADAPDNYPAGTVAMANAGPGTNGSQFFLVHENTTLPPDYTVFGRITEGLDVVRGVAAAGVEAGTESTPAQPVVLESVDVTETRP